MFISIQFLLAAVAFIAGIARAASTSSLSPCVWGYKPLAKDLIGSPSTLHEGFDESIHSKVWDVVTQAADSSIPDETTFTLSQGQDSKIHITKHLNDASKPNHVFTFNLRGNVPAGKGIQKGDEWQMFLYVKDGHPMQCVMPAFQPQITSIVLQQIK